MLAGKSHGDVLEFLDIIVTLLAILKSGAAYVPLDVDYPADRLAFMIKDSALSLLITQSKVLAKHEFDAAVPKLVLDAIKLEAESARNPQISVHDPDLRDASQFLRIAVHVILVRWRA
ncbi:MAG: AMP-binding protein [Nitrosomonas sp.]|nr:AMP-binding protein [Nitrosomonas sp.]